LPNRFLVYQHDTNEKFMCAHDVRTFSHGCMRIQDPAKYAEVLLNLARPSEHWTVDRVTRLYSGGEQDIPLPPTAIWVHVTYQSAFVDDSGKLQVRRGVWAIDSARSNCRRHGARRGAIDRRRKARREQPEWRRQGVKPTLTLPGARTGHAEHGVQFCGLFLRAPGALQAEANSDAATQVSTR
jgi:hypothetical protein